MSFEWKIMLTLAAAVAIAIGKEIYRNKENGTGTKKSSQVKYDDSGDIVKKLKDTVIVLILTIIAVICIFFVCIFR